MPELSDERRQETRDTIHPCTNKRYLSKSEVVQQLAEERQARYNAEKKEHYWKEKFKSQCIEMDREDDEDLSQFFLNIAECSCRDGLSVATTEKPVGMQNQKRLSVASKVSNQLLVIHVRSSYNLKHKFLEFFNHGCGWIYSGKLTKRDVLHREGDFNVTRC